MRAITFYDWMKTALYDPDHGYYQRSDRERWGRAGDYRTSPERSALFAATFARYFARLYEEVGEPREWTIVECGAGRGDFAFGVLYTLARQFSLVFQATRYVVYDVSRDALRHTQERLAGFGDRVRFVSDWNQIQVDNGIFFSNELLDAFPVHRVVQTEQGLAELYVDGSSWSEGRLSTPRLAEFCAQYAPELAVGQVIEINLEIDDWSSRVAGKLANGFVITVDYGAESVELYDARLRPNGTLRGFRRHEFVDDVLAQPGECDITASVNWTQVKTAGERVGFKVVEFASQDKFLVNAGLLAELEHQLSLAKTEAGRAALTTGAREMILPGGMASSFQVLVQRRVKEETKMSREFELIDVCHTVEHGMITYKGLPAPVISDYLSREDSHTRYAPGTEFHIGKIEMVANTGTYLDSPFHRYARGKDLASLDLYSIANLDGFVVRCLDRTEITEDAFRDVDVNGKAVLVHTGWDQHWRKEEYSSGNHPYLTEGAATYLAKNSAVLVGIDSFNIDATRDGNRPAHSVLLAHDIPIVEHLCGLGELPDSGFKFFAVPVKVRAFGTFPVRAFGIVSR